MIIIIIIIFILYYYLIVSFTGSIPKPQNILKKYVDFNGNLYENDLIVGKTNELFDYDTQAILKPFDYSILYNNNSLHFKTNTSEWKVNLTSNYYWNKNKILQKDECFGKGRSNILATGKNLYKHILQQDLLTTTNVHTFTDVYRASNIFYYTCQDDSIQGIYVCPPASVFDRGNCIPLDACTNKPDGFKYENPTNALKYYECLAQKSVSKFCPIDEIFQYDRCIKDVCFSKRDGFVMKTGHNTFILCDKGKAHHKTCWKNRYFLKDRCESELCFGKTDEIVKGHKIEYGPFSFHPYYVKCKDGKIESETKCPNSWDTSQTEVDITHLPQVFDGNNCVPPKLCENVQLKPDAVVPAYKFSKELVNWARSGLFDSVIGYNCVQNPNLNLQNPNLNLQNTNPNLQNTNPNLQNPNVQNPNPNLQNPNLQNPNLQNPNLQNPNLNLQNPNPNPNLQNPNSNLHETEIEPGKVIQNFEIKNGCNSLVTRVPTNKWNKFYDCVTQSLGACPPGQFFDGYECKDKVKNAFRYKYLDIFKFKNLHVNNWFKPRVRERNQTQITCQKGDEYVPVLNICTHPDCKPFTFIKNLKRPIKLNDEYECIWDEPTLKKVKYDKPAGMTLKFWEQRFVPENSSNVNECRTGHRVSTGNFVLDKTLYMTCRDQQPFVFCPSDDTVKIEKVTPDYFACLPHDKVYTYKLPANTNVTFITNEIFKIEIPPKSESIVNGKRVPPHLLEFIPDARYDLIHFLSNSDTVFHFKTLVNNPPDTYIQDKILRKVPDLVYDIQKDTNTLNNLKFFDYDLAYKIDGLKY